MTVTLPSLCQLFEATCAGRTADTTRDARIAEIRAHLFSQFLDGLLCLASKELTKNADGVVVLASANLGGLGELSLLNPAKARVGRNASQLTGFFHGHDGVIRECHLVIKPFKH